MIKPAIHWIIALPRPFKQAIAISVDCMLCLMCVAIAYYLRLGFWTMPTGMQWLSYGAAVMFAIPLFVSFGLYRAIFRFAGWDALMAVARACGTYACMYAIIVTFLGVTGVPRTVGFIQPVILLVVIGISRAAVRYILALTVGGAGQRRVLIYGAGTSGRQLAAALAGGHEVRVIGFVDDDPSLHRSVLAGRVIYPPSKLAAIVEDESIDDILLAVPSATRKRRSEILDSLRALKVEVRTIPDMNEIASGRVAVTALRELEIEDLLGRDVAPPNQILFARNILGKTVLVTGAGGSIGSELCRQILLARPQTLLLVDSSEVALYAIHQALSDQSETTASVVPLLASVRDADRLAAIFAAWRPETVYHAAAYKHVPMVEHNPVEGLRNNLFGTLITACAAQRAAVKDFVLISTDKAVRPTNVMGTSKRLAEMVLQSMAADGGPTRFSMVRFGNVLGSSGSVVPLFRQQIKAGGPVTVTDPEMTRYFMTIPEAAQLVIQAGAMAGTGEVFILDMGDPVKIIDLARKMIALSGATHRDAGNPDGDIAIQTIGLRPGEKLYEELLIGKDPQPTAHPLIMKARESFIPTAKLLPMLDLLSTAMDANDIGRIQALLKQLVPEYAPSGALPDWIAAQQRTG